MDLGPLGSVDFSMAFFYNLVSIVIIDLILAGDNAVVIAMAVRSLPPGQRKKGIVLGAGAAVLLRVALTFFISQLLQIPYLKLTGGILILWIAVKLFIEGVPDDDGQREATTVLQAVKVIMIADITMSLDNMLAVGGASHGNLFLLLFGLGLSIPFIVLTSGLLSMLMDRYPVIIYIGAAVLGRVGGEMILTDPTVAALFSPSNIVRYSIEAFFAVGVIIVGKILLKRMAKNQHVEAGDTVEAQSVPGNAVHKDAP